jgi:Leishmanolysin
MSYWYSKISIWSGALCHSKRAAEHHSTNQCASLAMETPHLHNKGHLIRKRALAVVGLLLPSMVSIEATHFSQHRLSSAHANDQRRKIPSAAVDFGATSESKTENDVGALWHVHVDASHHESPDKVFDAIRRGRRYSDLINELETARRDALSSRWFVRKLRVSESSGTKVPFLDDSFFNDSEAVGQPNRTEASSFNASVGTDYDVTAGVNATTVNDTASTVFATISLGSGNSTNVDSEEPSGASQKSETAATNSTSRTSNFRPLRMRAFLSELAGGGQHLTPTQRNSLMVDIIKPALLSWSAALRVEPVSGRNLTVDSTQLVDGVSCGPGGRLPSVIVPKDHLTIGVPDTDFILYISLAFQRNQTNSTESFIGSDSTESFLGSEIAENRTASQDLEDEPNNSTLYDDRKVCSSYLAASAFCSTDQLDRPTAAILHLCIGEDFFDAKSIKTNIMVVLHELGHALGFNPVSLAHFRRPDGTPYTERDPVTNEIPLTEINCTGPLGQQRTERIALPSSDILNFRTVRGGVRVAEVVTPSVRQVVRNHFDCQELHGAELESGEFVPLSTNSGEASCLGDHWERRLFKTDLMNPIVDENVEFNPRFSTVTLAYFADSGWYQVDLSRASLSAGWGRAAGCAFVEETCIEDGQVPSKFSSFFCNEAPSAGADALTDIHGCTTDMTRKASCSIDRYEGALPPEYQYFNLKYGANVGGTDPFMDYCPVYAGYANGLCSDSENEALIKVNLVERFGKRNSRCLSGQLTRRRAASTDSDGTATVDGSDDIVDTDVAALCLPIACVVEDQSLQIQVDGVWNVCRKKGDVIFLPELPVDSSTSDGAKLVSVVCPDPIRTCPTFYCNRDCLGTNRLCDYNVGRCVCNSTRASIDYASWNETSFAGTIRLPDTTEGEICTGLNVTQGGSFYEPATLDDSGLPADDSPLADYYYPTKRKLMESDGFWDNRWRRVIPGSATAICCLFALLFYWIIRQRRRQVSDGESQSEPPGEGEINRDKHKLMASVVVNIRMNDPNLRRRDALGNRDSETDLSMTETEGTGSDQPSLEEFYIPPPSDTIDGTMVDLSTCNDFASRLGLDDRERDYIDPLAPPSSLTPVVRRRRHASIFSTNQFTWQL